MEKEQRYVPQDCLWCDDGWTNAKDTHFRKVGKTNLMLHETRLSMHCCNEKHLIVNTSVCKI